MHTAVRVGCTDLMYLFAGICVLIVVNGSVVHEYRFPIGPHGALGFCTGACCLSHDVHQDG